MSNVGAAASAGSGVGFFGLLGIVFIVLRLTHVIDWSWWWVLAPLWGPFAFILGFLILALPVVMLVLWITGRKRK